MLRCKSLTDQTRRPSQQISEAAPMVARSHPDCPFPFRSPTFPPQLKGTSTQIRQVTDDRTHRNTRYIMITTHRAFKRWAQLILSSDYTRVGILILATSRYIGYKNCRSDAPMQQEGWVLPLPTYTMGAVHHEMGIRTSQLIVSRCRDSV